MSERIPWVAMAPFVFALFVHVVMSQDPSKSHAAVDALAASPVLPQAVTSFGAAKVGDDAYVYGGHIGREHAHSRENIVGSFRRVNLASGEIETLEGGPALQGLAMVAWKRSVIRVGGLDIRNAPGADDDLHSVAEVAAYDVDSRRWSPLPPLPSPRSSHDAVVVGSSLYVVGGWTLAGEERTWSKTVAILNLDAPQQGWREIEQPFERRALSAASMDGKLHVIGGLGADRETSKRIDVLDTGNESWSRIDDFPGSPFGTASIAVGDRIVTSGVDGTVWILERSSTEYRRGPRLVMPRLFHEFVAMDDHRVLVLGGADRRAHIAACETVDLEKASGPVVASWVIPYEGAAKNRQILFANGHELRLFGGNTSLEQHDFEPERFSNEGFSLDLTAMRLERLGDLPVRRQSSMSVTIAERGWMLGGFGHDGQTARSYDDVHVYDWTKESWVASPFRLPVPTTQAGVVAVEEVPWILGGLDYDERRGDDDAFRHLTSILMLGAEGVTPIDGALPRPRRAFGCARLGKHLILAGGLAANFERVRPVDVFDLESRTWTIWPSPPRHRISGDLAALGGKLWFACGSPEKKEGEPSPADLDVFDPVTSTWSTAVQSLPLPPTHRRMVALGDHLVFYSTHNERRQMQVVLVRP